MAAEVADRAHDVAEHIRDSDWPARVGRVGLCARGVIYACVALVALRVAAGDHAQEIERRGALEAVSHQPLGEVLLVILALGFAAHVLWRVMKAAIGASEGRDDAGPATDVGRRLLDLGRATVYVSLCVTAVRVLVRSESGGGSDQRAHDWSARLMTDPTGRWLVIAAGAALVVTGVVLVIRALAQKFEEHLDTAEMSAFERRWLPRLGVLGYGSRGVVAALVGAFLLQSGVTFDSDKAVGIDGALKRLAGQPFGPWLLSAVAIGLLAFGLYSFVEARWRKVLED